ncbi:MAG: hypothetical protein N4A47_04980 [Clostridia bacterium]|jgi:cell division septum initiation protein DivIVA|nr:hypothetical protein [Clostridia bacterium]
MKKYLLLLLIWVGYMQMEGNIDVNEIISDVASGSFMTESDSEDSNGVNELMDKIIESFDGELTKAEKEELKKDLEELKKENPDAEIEDLEIADLRDY